MIFQDLKENMQKFERNFRAIPPTRRKELEQLSIYIRERIKEEEAVNLNFICTHNSRRSHISQIWAQAAAAYYGIKNVRCYSGGTEVTAFNPRAVEGMKRVGFRINKIKEGENPLYEVLFSDREPAIIAFSKVYDDPSNPSENFCAVMTCSHADQNCPIMTGASLRLPLTFRDPKEADDTHDEQRVYNERIAQIGTELMYAMSKV